MLREGTKAIYDMGGTVRAFWSGVHEGSFRYFALCGSGVYELSSDLSAPSYIGSVDTSEGEAEFFYYRGSLYIVDGITLWRVNNSSLSVPFGYVPLVADGWSDNELGRINEPRNLLNPHARYEYIISETATSILRLDDYISHVDALYINGELISSDRYNLGKYIPYINVTGMNEGDRVCAYVTYRDGVEGLSRLMSATRAYVFGGVNTSRIFLYGTESSSVIFAASYASDDSIRAAQTVYGESDALYFGVGCDFSVGDGRYPVTALCRHYGRLLIFTEKTAWQADSSVSGYGDFPAMSINATVGASAVHGAAILGNSPYTVSSDGIYVWTSDTDELNDCNAYCVSEDISPLLPSAAYTDALIFADRKNDCLYIYSPSMGERMAVYHREKRAWSFFEGVCPHMFFETEDSVGFIKSGMIYVLDSAINTDSGEPIDAYYLGAECDMGTHKRKHLCGISARYEGENIGCEIFTDSSEDCAQELSFSGTVNTLSHEYRRAVVPRFKHFNIKINVSSSSPAQIHSLCAHLR